MQILVIHNPVAGRGRRRLLRRLLKMLAARGYRVRTRLTTRRGDAREAARTAENMDIVIVAGGDGTVAEVVEGLAQKPEGQPLPAVGFLPLGTANVLAWELGLPRHPDGLVRLIEQGETLDVTPGLANDHRFTLMASVGLDARAVAAVDSGTKRLLGGAAYVLAAFRALRQVAPYYTVSIDGRRADARTVIVTRARRYGGPFLLAPEAGLESPMLRVVMLRSYGLLAALRYGLALALGRLHRLRDVSVVSGQTVHVQGPDEDPVQIDGDVVTALPLTVSLPAKTVPFLVTEGYRGGV